MKMQSIVLACGLALAGLGGAAVAADVAGQVMIKDLYARAVPPGQPNSASFMMIKNTSDRDAALVSARCNVSQVTELHTHIMEDGMMKMRQVPRIELPAGQMVMLKPGGLHVMLIGLQQQLRPGDTVDLTLTFDDGSSTEVSAPVRKLQMKMMQGGMKHMQH
ncbi:MAG: hypothetical protein B0D86_01770 [Candidatus Sedimenticola endophacoides]|nr:MAG: hypothetical protein B0D86_01770 [Candidatus Sedimenticola endophacoides]